MPIEPPPTPWGFPDPGQFGPDDLIALGADLEPGTLLSAYRQGLFPMPYSKRRLGWWSPDPRGILPLDGLRVSRSLRKACARFEIRIDSSFAAVMRACSRPGDRTSWIDEQFIAAYTRLHELGWATSVEAWHDGRMVGGLYGVRIDRFFAGESMFHTETDASKAALVALVEWLCANGATLLDTQWNTPHLSSLGAIDIARDEYLRLLADAIDPPGGRGSRPPVSPDLSADQCEWRSPPPTGHTRKMADRDQPWMMRTYAGHSSARASNELYRTNLAKGQTGLSIAFDLPTQCGYDPDHAMARGEVGKVGVAVSHLGHMRALLDQIPPGQMNTSMTINATAAWMLALYVANAEEQGVPTTALRGTTQNDIVKEFLARGTYIFPPEPSRRLIVDMVAWCSEHAPKWNPMNACSYHLQEAGCTPVQEIAFSLATAIDILDAVRDSGQVSPETFGQVFGSISFFVSAGVRFIEETCKMRAFTDLWERIGRERYGVTDTKALRFRYGVQVNSLGLTEVQPENNVQRMVLEMLAVTLSKDARARSVQLPGWNEALGLPRPWDQQWSLRIQQVLAFESDLLEYGDIFEGSTVIEARTAELRDATWAELEEILSMGGAFAAIDELKGRLVRSMVERTRRIESGEQTVVGVNTFVETEPSLLNSPGNVLTVDPNVEAELIADLRQWRASRDQAAVDTALTALRTAAVDGSNIMPPSIALARAGGTTGEWAECLRGVFGEFRAPTGVNAAVGRRAGELAEVATYVKSMPGGPPRFLVAKPGLDGHSNGAEQVAVAARDAGMEVVYSGIRLTPEQIVASARDEDPDVIGLSILSGSHMELVPAIVDQLRAEGVDIPVVVGGIIPEADRHMLLAAGVSAVYTPKDFQLTRIMRDLADLTAAHRAG